MESLAEFIQVRREKIGLSITGLANKTNIKLETLEDIESGKELFFNNNLIKNHDNNDITFSYRLSQKQAYTFLSIIYYNASIYLNRKLDKFKEWKNCRPRVKALGLLEGKIGEGWDANPELTYYYNK